MPATLAFAIVNRLSRAPARTLRVVAVVALILSISPNLGFMGNPSSAPFPGGSALAFGALTVFYIVAAAVCVWALTTLPFRK